MKAFGADQRTFSRNIIELLRSAGHVAHPSNGENILSIFVRILTPPSRARGQHSSMVFTNRRVEGTGPRRGVERYVERARAPERRRASRTNYASKLRQEKESRTECGRPLVQKRQSARRSDRASKLLKR